MDELEANCARIVPLLESEGDRNRLLESLNENWLLVNADGLITDASDEEPNLKVRIEEAYKLVAKIGQDKLELTNQIAKKEADRSCTMHRLKNMRRHEEILGNCLTVKRDKMSILKLYLLHFSNKARRGKPIKPCLSVEEIAKHKSHFRVVHGTKTLAEEQKLLKEIELSQKAGVGPFSPLEEEDLSRPYYVRFDNFYKHQTWLYVSMPLGKKEGIIAQDRLREVRELERRRERLRLLLQRQRDGADTNAKTESVDYAFVEGKTWNAMGSEKSLRDQIKITGEEIDRFTKIQSAVWPKIKQIEAELKAMEKHLEPLKKKLTLMARKKDEAHRCLSKLIKQQNDVVQ